MKMNKKGVVEQLQALIIPIVGIAIVLVIGFLIFAEAKDQVLNAANANPDVSGDTYSLSNCTTAGCNGTNDVVTAMAEIPGWLPIIIITVIGALLLMLVTKFRGR